MREANAAAEPRQKKPVSALIADGSAVQVRKNRNFRGIDRDDGPVIPSREDGRRISRP